MATRLRVAITLAATLFGLMAAYSVRWICDDAYISFRYARNAVEGLGLVYNAGEYVEGYSNLLWTLWVAAGMFLGAGAEQWAMGSGLLCYGALIVLLCKASPGLPIAGVLLALSPVTWSFATSGLETSLFTALVTAGLLAAVSASGSTRQRLLGGLALGLASLTRPDGILFTAAAVAPSMLSGRPSGQRGRRFLELAGPTLLFVSAQMAFRLAYYGELLPNTYHAKSAGTAWYGQGLVYVGLFAERHWALVLAAGAAGVIAFRRAAYRPEVLVLGGAVVLYTVYVAHVGGDFMFGRLLAPTIPALCLLAQRAVGASTDHRVRFGGLVACAAALVWTPLPDGQRMWDAGIVDERTFADPLRDRPGRAQAVAHLLRGLDATVAFTGGDARLMFEARVPLAIEAETGLTDRRIAAQGLTRRGRVGHEKHAPIRYLRERRAVVTFRRRALQVLVPSPPTYVVDLGQARAYLLWRDEDVMEQLRRKGARIQQISSRSPNPDILSP